MFCGAQDTLKPAQAGVDGGKEGANEGRQGERAASPQPQTGFSPQRARITTKTPSSLE